MMVLMGAGGNRAVMRNANIDAPYGLLCCCCIVMGVGPSSHPCAGVFTKDKRTGPCPEGGPRGTL